MSGKSNFDASPHSAIGSASRTVSSAYGNSRTGRGDVRSSPFSADYLLLRGKTTHPVSSHACPERNTRWVRLHLNDVCREGRGVENQFDGSERPKLRSGHASQYEDWVQSQTCTRAGCCDQRPSVCRNDEQEWMRPFHLEIDDATQEQVGGQSR